MNCEYCGTTLKNRYVLKTHQNTAKYCLKLRNKTVKNFVCIYCDKVFTSKRWLTAHYQTCLEYVKTDYKRQMNEMKTKYESQLEETKIEYTQQIQALQDKLENVALKAVSRSTTTTHNTVNAIIQRLEPMTSSHIEDSVPNLTIEHIKRGAEGYAEYALKHPFKNRVVCVDYSRRKIKYKDEDGNVISDPEMSKLATRLFQSIKDRNKTLTDLYIDQLDLEDPHKFVDDMGAIAEYRSMVDHGADGQKTDLYHEFVKNVCSNTV